MASPCHGAVSSSSCESSDHTDTTSSKGTTSTEGSVSYESTTSCNTGNPSTESTSFAFWAQERKVFNFPKLMTKREIKWKVYSCKICESETGSGGNYFQALFVAAVDAHFQYCHPDKDLQSDWPLYVKEQFLSQSNFPGNLEWPQIDSFESETNFLESCPRCECLVMTKQQMTSHKEMYHNWYECRLRERGRRKRDQAQSNSLVDSKMETNLSKSCCRRGKKPTPPIGDKHSLADCGRRVDRVLDDELRCDLAQRHYIVYACGMCYDEEYIHIFSELRSNLVTQHMLVGNHDLACKKGLEEKRDFLMEKMVLVPSYIFETEQPFLTGNVLGAVGESNIPLPSDLDVHGAMATISNFVKSASELQHKQSDEVKGLKKEVQELKQKVSFLRSNHSKQVGINFKLHGSNKELKQKVSELKQQLEKRNEELERNRMENESLKTDKLKAEKSIQDFLTNFNGLKGSFANLAKYGDPSEQDSQMEKEPVGSCQREGPQTSENNSGYTDPVPTKREKSGGKCREG